MRVNPVDTQVYNAAYHARRKEYINARKRAKYNGTPLPEPPPPAEVKPPSRFADPEARQAYMREYMRTYNAKRKHTKEAERAAAYEKLAEGPKYETILKYV